MSGENVVVEIIEKDQEKRPERVEAVSPVQENSAVEKPTPVAQAAIPQKSRTAKKNAKKREKRKQTRGAPAKVPAGKPLTSKSAGQGRQPPTAKPAPAHAQVPTAPQGLMAGVPSQGQNNPPPVVPSKQPRKKFDTFLQACDAYLPNLADCPATEKCRKHLSAVGIQYNLVTPQGTVGTHPASALVREVATVKAFRKLYSAGCRRIFLPWGSSRDLRLLQRLNSRLQDPSTGLEGVLHQQIMDPKDVTRKDPAARSEWLSEEDGCDGALLVDIYWSGEGQPLTPEWVSSKLPSLKLIVLLMHDYRELLGSCEEEGLWYKTEVDGRTMVVSRPDASTEAYGAHPPNTHWMVSGTYKHDSHTFLVWTKDSNVSDTAMVVVAYTDAAPASSGQAVVEQGCRFQWRDLPAFGDSALDSPFIEWMQSTLMGRMFIGTRKVLIDSKLEKDLVLDFSGRSHSSFTFRQLLQNAGRKVEQDRFVARFQDFFPGSTIAEHLLHIGYYTAVSVFTSHVERNRSLLTAVSLTFGEAFAKTNSVVKTYGTEPKADTRGRPWLWYGLVGLGVTATVYGLWRWTRGNTTLVVVPGKPVPLPLPGAVVSAITEFFSGIKARMPESLSSCFTADNAYRMLGCDVAVPGSAALRCDSHKYYRLLTLGPSAMSTWDVMNPFGPIEPYLQVAGQTAVLARHLGALVIGSAIVEEYIKHKWPAVGRLMYISEFFAHCYTDGLQRSLPALMMHIIADLIPLKSALALHVGWNSTIWYGLTIGQKMTWVDGQFKDFNTVTTTEFSPVVGCGILAFLAAWRQAFQVSEEEYPTGTIWQEFTNNYYRAPWPERGNWTEMVLSDPFTTDQSFIPAETFPWGSSKPTDATAVVRDTLTPEVEPLAAGPGVWWYLPTNVPAYRPARSDANLRACVDWRLIATAPASVAWPKNWARDILCAKGLPSTFTEKCIYEGCFSPIPWDSEALRDDWYRNITEPAKRKRAARALEDVRDGQFSFRSPVFRKCKFMVKTDEVLLKGSFSDGVSMKPRLIIPVHPFIQAVAGPSIREATRRMKILWPCPDGAFSGGIPTMNGFTWHLTYGAGLTDRQLSEWFRAGLLLPVGHGAILVAGDDSYVMVNHPVYGLIAFEGDASQFDQSQGEEALRSELSTLAALGVDQLVLDMLEKTYHPTYSAHSRYQQRFGCSGKIVVHFTGTGSVRWERPTGGPDTTFGNTTTMAKAWLQVLETLNSKDFLDSHVIEMEFLRFGLTLKLKIHTDPSDGTFLKGMWYEVDDPQFSHYWAPLPSRILKLGKSLRDPCTLYRGKSRLEAFECFAHDMAVGYAAMGVQVPLIEAFIRRYMKEGAAPTYSLEQLDPEWHDAKPAFQGDKPRRRTYCEGCPFGKGGPCYRAVAARYDLGQSDWESMTELISQSSVCTFISHPGFAILAEVDYN